MKHFYQNIDSNPTWFDFQDLYSEMVKQADDKAHFVEIGAWLGRSTAYMMVEIINSGKNILFDVVDTFKGDGLADQAKVVAEHHGSVLQEFRKNLMPVLDRIHNVLVMDSVNASIFYDDNSLDFVFDDGAHDYPHVLRDNKSWIYKVKKGGVHAGHDIQLPSVKKAVREVFGQDYTIVGTSWVHRRK